MPTIIDSLLVTLGLDARGMSASAKAASGDIKSVGDAGLATGKDLDRAAQTIVGGLQKIRTEILGLFALLLAGRSLKQFTVDIINTDAALGRTAANLGVNTASLAAWGEAVKRAGGSAEGVQGSLKNLNAEFEQFKLYGTGGEKFIPILNLLGVKPQFGKDGQVDLDKLLVDLSGPLSKKSPQDAQTFGQQLGLDEGTVNLLRQGPDAVRQQLASAYKRGVPTDDDAKRSQAVQNSFYDLEQDVENLGRAFENDLTPTITLLFQTIDKWLQANKASFEKDIKALVDAFIHFLETVKWDQIADDLKTFGSAVERSAKALWSLFDKIATFLGIQFNAGDGASVNGASGYAGTAAREVVPQTTAEKQAAASKVIDYFTSSAGGGYTPAQAAGIAGNIEQESGFNPLAHNNTGHKGLVQWDATRQRDIEHHFGKRVEDMSFDEQLAAISWELRNSERATGDALHNVTTPDDAGALVSRGYERPGNDAVEGSRRGSLSARAYSDYLRKKAQHDQDLKAVQPLNDPSAPYIFGSLAPSNASRFAALASSQSVSNDNSSVTTINGPITIQTQATDAKGIAGAMKVALANTMTATQMNRGLA